jgi:hypothetical protein
MLDLVLQCRDSVLELRNLRVGGLELSGKLGIGHSQCGHGSTI